MIRASVICDSVNPQGIRLTSMKLDYPWFIHGEVMTHRVFSRNASSNRAIPLAKMLEEARSDELRAEPVYWGAEQKGMEPGGELDHIAMQEVKVAWQIAAHAAAHQAERMAQQGLHKSLCNRLLMPFTHAHVLVTATEWHNFLGLRLDTAADPTMRALAEAMWREWNEHEPAKLAPGQWHLPFIDHYTMQDIQDYGYTMNLRGALQDAPVIGTDPPNSLWLAIKISVARCARVSYETFETGKRSTVEADLALYERLLGNGHWSPFEHQATPDGFTRSGEVTILSGRPLTDDEKRAGFSPKLDVRLHGFWDHPEQHGNFRGWCQYRKMMAGEAVRPLPEQYRREK